MKRLRLSVFRSNKQSFSPNKQSFSPKKHKRLYVFRSNKYIYGQIIDDEKGRTIVTASDLNLSNLSNLSDLSKTERARLVGRQLAEKALEKKVKEVVFDRGSYKYHGRVKALAEGARDGGLKF